MSMVNARVEKSESMEIRHTRRFFLAGLTGLGLSACGGGGGESSSTTGSKLAMTTFSGTDSTAKASLLNTAGEGFSLWTDPGTQALTQASYKADSGSEYRVFYGPSQEVQRVQNVVTGEFLLVTAVNSDRTDYNVYNSSGKWMSGWAIVKNSDGSYSTAQILGASDIQGSQLTLTMSGAVTASMSLLPGSSSGLGPLTVLKAGASPVSFALFTEPARQPRNVASRLLDMLVSPAYAATTTASATRSAVGGALLAAMGGVVVAGAAGSVGIGLAGVALTSYGSFQIYRSVSGLQNGGLDILDSASAALIDDFLNNVALGANALTVLRSRIDSYLQNGAAALPGSSGIASSVQQTTSATASQLSSTATATLQGTTSSPPTSNTDLIGLAVDSNGNSYIASGTYNPTTKTLTFNTNAVNATSISGTANATTNAGTYQVTTSGVTNTGTVVLAKSSTGSCQTQQDSGEQGAFTKAYDLGVDSGTFSMTYEMYTIKDEMTIRNASGGVLFTTNGLVSGGKTVQVTYSGGRFVFVSLNAPTQGTLWKYEIGCPI